MAKGLTAEIAVIARNSERNSELLATTAFRKYFIYKSAKNHYILIIAYINPRVKPSKYRGF
ncbi:MAG: hypothetical protein AAB925_01900, partial [Patescibacteria group bacterium]